MDEDQHRYLFGLVGEPSTRAPRKTVQKVQPQLQHLLDDKEWTAREPRHQLRPILRAGTRAMNKILHDVG